MFARLKIFCALVFAGATLLGGCATTPKHEPVQVLLVGAEPMQGEGLEVRMLIKLRVQNPNDAPLDFNGVYATLEIQGKTFATGVSAVHGSVPRFGETVVEVPVSTSAFRIARQVLAMTSGTTDKLAYRLSGKLSGSGFSSEHFEAKGEYNFPIGGAAP